MASIRIFTENRMVNFQEDTGSGVGDKIPYGRSQIEPRYKDTTVSFYHKNKGYLKIPLIGGAIQQDFLFTEVLNDSGSPIGGSTIDDIQAYMSDKVGFFSDPSAGGTPGLPLNSVQYNSAGSLAGDASMLFNSITKQIDFVGNPLSADKSGLNFVPSINPFSVSADIFPSFFGLDLFATGTSTSGITITAPGTSGNGAIIPVGGSTIGISGNRFSGGFFSTVDSSLLFATVAAVIGQTSSSTGSAVLDINGINISGKNKGALLPVMTTAQRDVIEVPAEGLLIFNTDTGQFEFNTEAVQTSGLLEIGKEYTIYDYIATDDFTNVGASSNATGEIFTSTGTTPTDWTNGSSLAIASENWVSVSGLDTLGQYTKQQYFGEVTLIDAANISWDLDNAQTASVTLTASRTLDNPSNMKAGATYVIRFIQGGAGSFGVTFGSAYVTADDSGVAYTKTLSTAVSSYTTVRFYCDGSNMIAIP